MHADDLKCSEQQVTSVISSWASRGWGAREHSTRTLLLHAAFISFTGCSPAVDVALLLAFPHAAIGLASPQFSFPLVFIMVSRESD